MYLKKETLEIQNNLGDYCRTGVYKNIDGVSQERLTHYRRLVFGNVKSVLEKAYPITLEWLSEDEWLILVNDFFEFHDSQSPKIWELPQEFMEFVKTNGYDRKFDKPALNDLLLIEWIEIEVHTMMDIEVAAHRKHGDLLNDALVLVPEFRLIKLDYPVHAFNGDEAVEKKGDWFIYVFRNRTDDGVRFLNVSALHVLVLEKLYEEKGSLASILPIISSVFGLDDIQQLTSHLKIFISDLQHQGALLGFCNTETV